MSKSLKAAIQFTKTNIVICTLICCNSHLNMVLYIKIFKFVNQNEYLYSYMNIIQTSDYQYYLIILQILLIHF